MTKAEFYRDNYANLLSAAHEELKTLILKVVDKHGEGENHILFYEVGVGSPIYKEDLQETEFSHIISSAWITKDKVGFMVEDGYDMSYDIGMDDIDMDMVVYLLDEFENVKI